MKQQFFLKLILALSLLLLTACGGGGSSSNNETTDVSTNVTDTNTETTSDTNSTSNSSETEESTESSSDVNSTSNSSETEESTENTSDVNSTSNSSETEENTESTSDANSTSNSSVTDESSESSSDTNSTSNSNETEDSTENTSDTNSTSNSDDAIESVDDNSSEVSEDSNQTLNNDENSTENNSTVLLEAIQKAKSEPYFKYAWHIESNNSVLNESDYNIDDNADINLTEAWKLTMGEGVKVAVIDDGAEVEHEDLKENILLAYNADTQGSEINPNAANGSHGNTCAGFIVAPINETGIVGVAPQAKVIAIRQEASDDAKVIHAFEYAKNNGAKVISCSWGSENVSEAVVAQLKNMYDAGITVLFASGNDGKSLDQEMINDESEVEWVLGVGASGENNDVTSYSNFGQEIEFIAPGGDAQESSGILGLDDMGDTGATAQLNLVNNNYAFTNGTSFATPVAAGVVTLMYAVNPNITPQQVREILIKTTDQIGTEVDADYSNNDFDTKRAYGKINAGKAVLEAKNLAE